MRGLTRREVAVFLRTSVATVRRMEGKKLHPVRDEHGVHRFDADEIKPLASSMPLAPLARAQRFSEGRLAAKLFALFEQGMSISDIVISTRQSPRVVRDLYHEWRTSLDEGEDQRRIDEQDRKDSERDAAISSAWQNVLRGIDS